MFKMRVLMQDIPLLLFQKSNLWHEAQFLSCPAPAMQFISPSQYSISGAITKLFAILLSVLDL